MSCCRPTSRASGNLLPLFEIEGMLTLAIGDPVDVFVLDEVGPKIGLEVEPVLAESDAVAAAIEQYYTDEPDEPDEPESRPRSSEPTSRRSPATQDAAECGPRRRDSTPTRLASQRRSRGAVGPRTMRTKSTTSELGIAAADFFEVADDTREVVDAPTDVTEALGGQVTEAAELSEELAEAVEDDDAAAGRSASAADRRGGRESSEGSAGSTSTCSPSPTITSSRCWWPTSSRAAVARGANRIHLFPYKSDFFLVFRIARSA